MLDRSDPPDPAHVTRQRALQRALAADEAAHASFDRLARLAARTLRTPVAQVNLVTDEQQISVSSYGPGEWNGPRHVSLQRSFCRHVVDRGESLVVEDARTDPLVRDSPSTTGSGIVAYAAVPLMVAEDIVVGTLCVVDFTPRIWSAEDVAMLETLATFVVAEIERRGRTEAELTHLASLLESTEDAVIGADLDGTIRSWNAGAERMFGFGGADILGRTVMLLAPSGCDQEIHSALERARRGESTPRFDCARLRRDGSRVSVSIVVTPVHDLAGRVIGCTALVRDITSRMEAVHALAESEGRFRQLAENVDAVFWLRDARTRELLYVSPAYERIWGRSPEEFRDHPRAWADAIPEAEREWVLNEMDASRSGEYDVEYRIVRADGEERWVRDRGFPVQGPDGETVRIAGIVDDVTERRRAREDYARSEARFRALIEHSAEVISVVHADGSILYESPAIERVLGYTPEELQGISFFQFLHPDDKARAEAAFAQLLREGAPVTTEIRCRHRDGAYRVLAVTGTALVDDPAVRGIVVNSRDVTELREREERLRQSQRLEAVGRLAGGIAHDFNNVLTVVKASASMALMDIPSDDPVRADLREIAEATERGARLTRQLLAFSRQQVLEPKLLDLNEIVAEMGTMLRRTLGPDVEFVTFLEPRLGRVMADPGQVEQIMMNLAVNARDAMPEGGRLTARTANVELGDEASRRFGFSVEPGAYVCLTFEDTGTGIADEVRERVFEPYFTTKERGKGNGLGLATVYGIVKQSGGYILLRSSEGRGTVFDIYLPWADVVHAPPGPAPEAEEVRREPTVLLVEDEPTVRALACRALTRAGFRVLQAADGEDGVRVADVHKGTIDLLLTDVMMPRMGGRELAARLTAAVPGLPVLYTSGYTEEAALRDGGLSGAAFLQKPYDPAELVAKARQIVDRRGAER